MAATANYHFGTQTADSFSNTLRASYTFTPELSLQLYSQLFLARVNYGPFFTVSRVTGVRDRSPSTRWDRPGGAAGDQPQPQQSAGDVERQRRAALGVPPRLDAVRRLHARPTRR